MEIHHRSLLYRGRTPKINETWDLEKATLWGDEAMELYRHTGYKLIKIIKGTNAW